jgi:hypothetical protein
MSGAIFINPLADDHVHHLYLFFLGVVNKVKRQILSARSNEAFVLSAEPETSSRKQVRLIQI